MVQSKIVRVSGSRVLFTSPSFNYVCRWLVDKAISRGNNGNPRSRHFDGGLLWECLFDPNTPPGIWSGNFTAKPIRATAEIK